MGKITIFRRHSTDGALFVQSCLIVYDVCMKNSVLTYFEKDDVGIERLCMDR